MEYVTTYPKSISFLGGIKEVIKTDSLEGVEQLHVVVKRSFEDLSRILYAEGFTRVKFEHKQPNQIGNGFNLKLKKPWEMHVRITQLKKDLVAIHGEVEVSRDYLQHLFCQRTPVVYEIGRILKRHGVEYKIWNGRISKFAHEVIDNYKVRLSTPSIPVLAWKPMTFFIGAVGCLYLWKYLLTI
jgi:hypothetical protein